MSPRARVTPRKDGDGTCGTCAKGRPAGTSLYRDADNINIVRCPSGLNWFADHRCSWLVADYAPKPRRVAGRGR